MKNMKKLIALMLACAVLVCCALTLAGCGDNNNPQGETTNTESTENTAGETENNYTEVSIEQLIKDFPKDIKNDTEHEAGYQLEMPQSGDEIAIIRTTMGDITLRLFPENAPNTVKNFVELAKAGTYDNVPFHRVINDFMIQTGDTTKGDGTGGATYNESVLYDEFCDKLYNLRGSVSMANSGRDTNGSQFFINQATTKTLSSWDSLKESWDYIYEGICNYYSTDSFPAFAAYYGSACYNPDLVPDEVKALYEQYGGNPHLDGCFNVLDRGHTVFGQVIDGMDVVDSIAAVKTDAETNAPLEKISIKTIEITTY